MPVVVLEPSCAAVFRDELLNSFPDDARARKLARTGLSIQRISGEEGARLSIAEAEPGALVHGHCHHKSVMKMTDEESVLRKWGDFQAPASGCCGMAGAFGFEHENYDIPGGHRRDAAASGGTRVLQPTA